MPSEDLKIKTKELDEAALQAIAQKYVIWRSTRPSKRLWEMRSTEDLTGATNPDYVQAKEAYYSALATVPNSQKPILEKMQMKLWEAKSKS